MDDLKAILIHFDASLLEIVSYFPQLVQGLLITVELTVIVMAISLAGGLGLAIGRTSDTLLVRLPCRMIVGLMRGTPLLLQLFYVYFVFPAIGLRIEAFPAAVVALSLNYSAYISEVYRSGIAAIPRGQIESCMALGMSRRKTLRFVILPQAIRMIIPPLGNYFVSLIKDTALASTITVNEVMFKGDMIASTSFRYFQVYTAIGTLYFFLSWAASHLVVVIEKRLQIGRRRPALAQKADEGRTQVASEAHDRTIQYP